MKPKASKQHITASAATTAKATLEEMWAKQKISSLDVDYGFWIEQKSQIKQMSKFTSSCLFTVDVFKKRYDFASENFADIFGFNSLWLDHIEKQGDILEERFHPDDRYQLLDIQIRHSEFIYSLPAECRNDYSSSYQLRMLNRKQEYINVISRQRVIQKDRNGKAWIIMGAIDISPDQTVANQIKCSFLNMKTGDIIYPLPLSTEKYLTKREKEILNFIRQGLLTKEIAYKLGVSIHTINNHRKNILEKLDADNAIEAINQAEKLGL